MTALENALREDLADPARESRGFVVGLLIMAPVWLLILWAVFG